MLGFLILFSNFNFSLNNFKKRGIIIYMKKVGRNDPCPCGSGNKYKKCCIDKERQNPVVNRKVICPIHDTHSRLNQAFSLFDDVLRNYQNELKFTSTLNNLIQNLRNITFILQKELAHEDGFKEWYANEQDIMKENKELRWLINTRNHIVKIGDLQKRSYAKISLKDHYNHEVANLEINPTFSNKKIIDIFRNKIKLKIQKNLRSLTIIEIERIWITDDYPNIEIIDILIYCFGILTDLVYRAHEKFSKISALMCEKNIFVNSKEDFMSVIHNKIKKGRIIRMNYETGAIYTETCEAFNLDERSVEKISQHYGGDKFISSIKNKINQSDFNLPFNNVPFHIEMAKNLFKHDGFLAPIAFLYLPKEPPIHLALGCTTPETRYIMSEYLAEKVEEINCKAIIIVSEAWGGNMPKKGEEYIPPHIQKKKEFIWVIAANPKETRSYQIEIFRDASGMVTLGEEKELENASFPMLDRIYKIWKIKK